MERVDVVKWGEREERRKKVSGRDGIRRVHLCLSCGYWGG